MPRLCERPGCAEPGQIAYGFDTTLLLVWLQPLDPAVDPNRAGVLCLRHADSMVLPRGWSLDDSRDVVPRLFKPRLVAVDESETAAAEAPSPKTSRRGGGRRRRSERQLRFEAVANPADGDRELDAETAAAPAAGERSQGEPPTVEVAVDTVEPVVADATGALTVANVTGVSMKPEPDATEALPWKPEFEADDELDDPDAELPLLARSATATDHRHR